MLYPKNSPKNNNKDQSTDFELRTSLGVILAYAHLMEEELYGPLSSKQKRALSLISDNCRLIQKLLTPSPNSLVSDSHLLKVDDGSRSGDDLVLL